MKRLAICLAVLVFAGQPSRGSEEAFRFPEGRQADRAELKYVNGLPVLVVSGSPAEMGRAAGALALKPGRRALDYPRELLGTRDAERLWPVIVQGGKGMYERFPDDYKQELEALVAAAGVSREPVVVGNTFFDLKKVFACSAVGVERERSATGGTLLARNLDYPSLGYVQQYSLVTVYRRPGKRAFASIGFPGLIGCLSGINDAGLSLGVLEVFDVKEGEASFNAKGLPYALCNRRLLEECATIEEARKKLEGLPRTSTMSLAIADREHVAVFEITPKKVVVRPARKGACFCTNHFHTPPLRPARPVNVARSFERFAHLMRLRDQDGKVGPAELRAELHAVNLGDETLQTMVFEPAALRLHLSVGPLPASLGPLRTLELKPLFAGKAAR